MKEETKHELLTTGIIGTLGGVATKIYDKTKPTLVKGKFQGTKGFALGAGLGLVADYAGLKAGKLISKPKNEITKSASNKYLVKIAGGLLIDWE